MKSELFPYIFFLYHFVCIGTNDFKWYDSKIILINDFDVIELGFCLIRRLFPIIHEKTIKSKPLIKITFESYHLKLFVPTSVQNH